MSATISMVILAHNKSQYTRLALTRLLHSAWARVECILFDNGSTDDTPQVFRDFAAAATARGWRVECLRADENVGAITGRNRAMRAVTGDYVVFMDNDIVIAQKSWLTRLVTALAEDSSLGVIGPKILFAAPPQRIQCAGCVVGRGGRVGFRGRLAAADDPAYNQPAEVQALISACWMLPRRVMEAVGEFDLRYHPVQFEDIDYCYRLRELGFKAKYDPAVYVYHYENVTTAGTAGLNYKYLTVKNGLKFKTRWRETIAKENGPDDASMEWEEVPAVPFSEVGELPLVD